MTVLDYIKDIFDNPSTYAKFWVAFGAAVLSTLSTYFPDAPWLPVLITFAGTFGVFAVKNK